MKLIRLAGALLIGAVPASQASAERLFGLTSNNAIVTFDSSAPLVETSRGSITGIAAGDSLIGLDLRPATRSLYSVGTSGNVYSLVKVGAGYVATSVGTTSPTPSGATFGLDFNPVPDRIRLVSDTNQNLRINPANGATIVDGAITLNGSSAVDLIGAAYTNSRAGALTTVLYGLDSVSGGLVRSTNPNAGTYVNTNLAGAAFGALGVAFTNRNFLGFDISGATGSAFFNVDNALYGLDLTTGAGTLLGSIGSGSLVDLTAGSVPEPATWVMLVAGFGFVGASLRRRAPRSVAA